jgi:hypothetical protein
MEIIPGPDDQACHAFLAPGCSLALYGRSCTIGLPGGEVRLELDADGLPS